MLQKKLKNLKHSQVNFIMIWLQLKKKKKYIPPLTHTWKLESFRKYMIKIGKDLV